MITIPEIVKEYVEGRPYLHSFLNEGIINISSLARKIHPYIEERTQKDVKLGSIIMAINRYESDVQNTQSIKKELAEFNNYHVQNDISLLTFRNSDTLEKSKNRMLTEIDEPFYFYLWINGSKETNLVIEAKNLEKILPYYKNENVIINKQNLTIVSLELPDFSYTKSAIGVFYVIFEKLSLNNVNIIEIVSTPNELSIIVEKENINKLFHALFNL